MNYKIVAIILVLLFSLSVSTSVLNYFVSLNSTQKQLQTASLPLTTDNIYSEIQSHIIKPNLVASMMAQDTFLKEWLNNRENNIYNIKIYLESIKNRYNVLTAFLVSEDTNNYYNSTGLVEKISKDNKENKWYFEFKNSTQNYEINLDFNKHIDNSMIMFINHKIFDKNFHLMGATGVGFKISYIDEMLKQFRLNYNFKVYFINNKGELVLYEKSQHKEKNINYFKQLKKYKDKITNKNGRIIKVQKNNQDYFYNIKYIKELDLYLVVEAKIESFTKEIKQTFYINLFISIFITLLVAISILYTMKQYNKQLEHLAMHDTLTKLPNRRNFNKYFKEIFYLYKKQKNNVSLIFFDIDNFKKINDTLGHNIGDEVLKQISNIIKNHIRKSDLIARWGGEEFIIALTDSDIQNSKIIAEKLRNAIEEDEALQKLLGYKATASFGLTQIKENDNFDTVINRVDDCMYEAKRNGKNQVSISN